jgi:hypothetical protein
MTRTGFEPVPLARLECSLYNSEEIVLLTMWELVEDLSGRSKWGY